MSAHLSFRRYFLALLLLCAAMVSLSAQETLWKLLKYAEGAGKVYEAYTISDEDLADYVREAMKQEDTQHTVCDAKSKYTIRLNRLTKNMTSVGNLRLNFKVYLDSETANAFACPDGSIRVYSHLMDLMTDDELLGVLAHEFGHVACRHSLKAYKKALLYSAGRDCLMAHDGTLGELAYSALGDVSEYMLNAKFSRTQETEADNFGYTYLVEHGVNPCAMVKAFCKLRDADQGIDSKHLRALLEMVSTHPDLENRINYLSARAADDGYTCSVCH